MARMSTLTFGLEIMTSLGLLVAGTQVADPPRDEAAAAQPAAPDEQPQQPADDAPPPSIDEIERQPGKASQREEQPKTDGQPRRLDREERRARRQEREERREERRERQLEQRDDAAPRTYRDDVETRDAEAGRGAHDDGSEMDREWRDGDLNQAVLGVWIQDTPQGVCIVRVEPQGPAFAAGLIPGDCIARIDGNSCGSCREVFRSLGDHETGHAASLVVLRNGQPLERWIELAERGAVFGEAATGDAEALADDAPRPDQLALPAQSALRPDFEASRVKELQERVEVLERELAAVRRQLREMSDHGHAPASKAASEHAEEQHRRAHDDVLPGAPPDTQSAHEADGAATDTADDADATDRADGDNSHDEAKPAAEPKDAPPAEEPPADEQPADEQPQPARSPGENQSAQPRSLPRLPRP
jgi:hypothetical protein